jgi:hypothetical protein
MAKTKKEADLFAPPNPGVSWGWLINLLIAALAPIVTIMSEGIRKELVAFLKAQYATAKESPNPWDDYLFAFFLSVMGEKPE